MSQTPLSVMRGDTQGFVITFQDANEDPINITGATVYMTLKNAQSDLDASAVLQKVVTSHTTPLSGITTITITPANWASITAGEYYYDIQLSLATGEKYTPLYGRMTVIQDTTLS